MASINSVTGTVGQLLFHARLKQNGFEPLFVSDGALSFDVGAWCDKTQRFFRVQIKTTTSRHSKNFWRIFVKMNNRKGYTKEEADVLALYAAYDESFFIMPVESLAGTTSLLLPVKGSKTNSPYEKCRENWSLFAAALP